MKSDKLNKIDSLLEQQIFLYEGYADILKKYKTYTNLTEDEISFIFNEINNFQKETSKNSFTLSEFLKDLKKPETSKLKKQQKIKILKESLANNTCEFDNGYYFDISLKSEKDANVYVKFNDINAKDLNYCWDLETLNLEETVDNGIVLRDKNTYMFVRCTTDYGNWAKDLIPEIKLKNLKGETIFSIEDFEVDSFS